MAIRTTYKYKCDLDKGTLETTLRNSLMQADALADAFAVTVQRNGADVDISGMTVYGYLYANATKTTVPLKGAISGSTATVILSEDCYAVPGYASLMIQLHDGDVRHTVLKVDFVVTRTGGTLVLDGDNILPTLAELLGQIAAMEQATAEAREATAVANQAVENVEAFKGEIQGDLTALSQENGQITRDLDMVEDLSGIRDLMHQVEWAQGAIASADGAETDVNNRIRTDYIPVSPGGNVYLVPDAGYKMTYSIYNADKQFLKGYPFSQTGFSVDANVSYIRLVLAHEDNSQITPGDAEHGRAWLREADNITTPEAYGAAGDGVTDDTKAMQAWLDSHCTTLNMTPGKTYFVTAPLILSHNDTKQINGHRSGTLRIDDTFAGDVLLTINGFGVEVKDITFRSKTKYSTVKALKMYLADSSDCDGTVTGCSFVYFDTCIAHYGRGLMVRDSSFTECLTAVYQEMLHGSADDDEEIRNPPYDGRALRIINNRLHSWRYSCYLLHIADAGYGEQYHGAQIVDNVLDIGGAIIKTACPMVNCLISGNISSLARYLDNPDIPFLFRNDVEGLLMANNVFTCYKADAEAARTPGHFLQFGEYGDKNAANNIIVRSNIFRGCQDAPVLLTNGADNINIAGNSFDFCGKYGANHGLINTLGDVDVAVITDNTCVNSNKVKYILDGVNDLSHTDFIPTCTRTILRDNIVIALVSETNHVTI